MMKKLLLFALCLNGLFGTAQNDLSFAELKIQKAALNEKFRTYKVLELTDDLQRLSDGQSITIHLDRDYSFVLKENRILAENYKVTLKDGNGISRKTLDDIGFDGKYFTGQTDSGRQLAFSMFEDRYSFYIKTGSAEFYIEPLKNTDKSAASNQYVYYDVKDIVQSGVFNCGFKADDHQLQPEVQSGRNATTGGCKTVNLDFYIDYSMYATYGSVNGAINRTLELLNLSQVNYTIANGLSDEVSLKVEEHYIVTCDHCGNWPSTLEIQSNFDNFSISGYYQYFENPIDHIKVLFQNEGGSGVIAGLASPYTCNSTGFTVLKNYINDTDQTRNVLSHELGHNLGCQHTTGFIMNPSVDYSTAWAPESIAVINNTVNTLSCITDCNPLPCDGKKVAQLNVSPDTDADTVTISWLSVPGMVYKVKLLDLASYEWSDVTTLSYPQNSITYPITQAHCTDRYRFVIVPLCGNAVGITENVMFNVSQNADAPALLYWTGFTDNFWGTLYPYPVLCSGKPYYCSLTGIDGGTAPVYQWKVNGLDVGTNSSTILIDNLHNNDVLSCTLTSNAACVASPTAYFSTVVSVTDPIHLTLDVAALSSTTICAGESVTFNEIININQVYQLRQQMILESYFNGVPVDLFLIADPFASPREFTFTPTESGTFYCYIGLLHDGNGVAEGCYLNDSVNSIPIEITVLPQPCNLAVSDFEISGLQYYPNPIHDILSVEAAETITGIAIYNVIGQEVISKTIQLDKATLDVAALDKGTYFLKIHAGDKTKNVKIIKE